MTWDWNNMENFQLLTGLPSSQRHEIQGSVRIYVSIWVSVYVRLQRKVMANKRNLFHFAYLVWNDVRNSHFDGNVKINV